VIKELYSDQELRGVFIGTLIKKGCSESKAKELFVDAIMNFIKMCYKPDFAISNLSSYIVGIGRNLFFRAVTKRDLVTPLEENISLEDERTPEILLIREERKGALHQLLSHLDNTCREVLVLWSQKIRMREIAKQLEYKSEGMARKKKHQCLQRLYKIVAENPELKNDLRSML
jgi:RNA polymerase sigma factor (sigma-70 family)